MYNTKSFPFLSPNKICVDDFSTSGLWADIQKNTAPLGQTRLDLREPLEQSLSLTDNLSQESLEIEHHPHPFTGRQRHSNCIFCSNRGCQSGIVTQGDRSSRSLN
ncbi:hypothetical protein CEXT_757151 [Caerostris extrusa]|uniref:Uncharacterized protein n=1 Tax=Caerostris extrusa TaxID=172846 RepID=A0AAV4V8L2_CAEEX|nr:hypothetical protein CEXT_757151 [Caerostris extrusa]